MFVPQLWPGTCTGHTPAQDELGRASPPIGSQHTPHPNIFWKFSTALKVCGSCQPAVSFRPQQPRSWPPLKKGQLAQHPTGNTTPQGQWGPGNSCGEARSSLQTMSL